MARMLSKQSPVTFGSTPAIRPAERRRPGPRVSATFSTSTTGRVKLSSSEKARTLRRLERTSIAHRLSGKIAGLTAAVVAVLLAVVWSVTDALTPMAIPIGSIAAGVGAYFATYVAMARRLELARAVLRQIRKHRFENLDLAQTPKGDEMNDLIWQVYRTGQVLESEFQELTKIENYRREFVGNVSHELKTPIFAIRGFAETLKNDGAS